MQIIGKYLETIYEFEMIVLLNVFDVLNTLEITI